jgi:hypothetical protein
MRKSIISITLFVFFYLAIPQVFCQDLKLLNPGNIWSNLIQTSQSENCCTFTRFIKFSGDTIIQSQEYKKVLQSEDSTQTDWETIGFVREDPQKGLYYKELYYTQQERLLYLYNLKLNDTIKIQGIFDEEDSVSFIVSNVEEVLINGNIKKKFTLNYPEYNNFTETWIESVGSLHGILRDGFYHCLCNNYALLCCLNTDMLIYKNPDYDQCYYRDTPTIAVNQIKLSQFKIIQDFSTQNITIKFPDGKQRKIAIYNINGTLVDAFFCNESEKELNISNFQAGLYFIVSTGEHAKCQKFIKK